jgi:hypothetical protein
MRLILYALTDPWGVNISFPAYRKFPPGSMARVDGLAVDAFDPEAGKAGATTLKTVNFPVERLSSHR